MRNSVHDVPDERRHFPADERLVTNIQQMQTEGNRREQGEVQCVPR